MTSSTRITTRILILSDTHSALPSLVNKPDLKFCQQFPEADVAIHCGDLTSCGRIEEHQRALSLLKSLPAPIKIVIPGNHDMTLDKEFLQNNERLHGWRRPHSMKDLEEATEIYTGQEATEAGIKYLVEGVQSFVLPNGAKLTVYVSAYTPEFWGWAFPYARSEDRYNIKADNVPAYPVPSYSSHIAGEQTDDSNVAVMVTHGPPLGILDTTVRGDKVGCEHLMTAVGRCRPLLHCFGHIHEGWGAEVRAWPEKPFDGGAAKSGQPPRGLLDAQALLVRHPDETDNSSMGDLDQRAEAASVVDATKLDHGAHTLFVNASIMDVRYVPRQWPWLVKLQLPKASVDDIEAPRR